MQRVVISRILALRFNALARERGEDEGEDLGLRRSSRELARGAYVVRFGCAHA